MKQENKEGTNFLGFVKDKSMRVSGYVGLLNTFLLVYMNKSLLLLFIIIFVMLFISVIDEKYIRKQEAIESYKRSPMAMELYNDVKELLRRSKNEK